jgi:hypothetical protein
MVKTARVGNAFSDGRDIDEMMCEVVATASLSVVAVGG